MKKTCLKLGTYATLVVAGLSILALGGCEDEKIPVKVRTTSELICANFWELHSIPIEPALDLGGGIKLTDYMQELMDCEKDNYFKYRDINNQKTYVHYEGILKCDPTDKDSTIDIWTLSADGKTFEQDGQQFKLILIDDNNMHIRIDSFLQNSSITLKYRKRI